MRFFAAIITAITLATGVQAKEKFTFTSDEYLEVYWQMFQEWTCADLLEAGMYLEEGETTKSAALVRMIFIAWNQGYAQGQDHDPELHGMLAYQLHIGICGNHPDMLISELGRV